MMTKSLQISYVTARDEPRIDWFLESLKRQLIPGDLVDVVIVDLFQSTRVLTVPEGLFVRHIEPKPTIWQGKHRITKDNWWAKSNALNTAIAVCNANYFACVDDRSILCPGWMQAVRDAMSFHYAVCGPYEKVIDLVASDGNIISYTEQRNGEIPSGKDNRLEYAHKYWRDMMFLQSPWKCPGEWWYGCSTALPLQWALEVNGFPEDMCDSLSAEDGPFGRLIENCGRPIYYDERLKILEDRTAGSDQRMRRSDFGPSPQDKSHAVLEKMRVRQGELGTQSLNSYDLSALRERTLKGEPWPMPTASHKDWWDGADIPAKFDGIP